MKSIKEKAVEYAKTKHTNQNLIEIVSWDFEAGANYALKQIEKQLDEFSNFEDSLIVRRVIERLKSNQ